LTHFVQNGAPAPFGAVAICPTRPGRLPMTSAALILLTALAAPPAAGLPPGAVDRLGSPMVAVATTRAWLGRRAFVGQGAGGRADLPL
jgi:hypothetical protein